MEGRLVGRDMIRDVPCKLQRPDSGNPVTTYFRQIGQPSQISDDAPTAAPRHFCLSGLPSSLRSISIAPLARFAMKRLHVASSKAMPYLQYITHSTYESGGLEEKGMTMEEAIGHRAAQKWSLWRSANIGIGVSAAALLLQVANGRGFELASYAHTRSAETIGALGGQVLAAPLLFVVIAAIRNVFKRGQAKSNASAIRGAITFAAVFVTIFVGLFTYGELVFSRDEAIDGEARRSFIADTQFACVQKQASLNQAITQQQIQTYCTCMTEKMADTTTYKQLGTELAGKALADLQQKVGAISNLCRQ